MTYCKKCGAELPDHTFFCTNCGAEINPQTPQTYQTYTVPPQRLNDSGHIGWGILGFIFPFIGLILFLLWRRTKPATARMAGMGALISVGLSFAFSLLGSLLSF